MKILIAITLIVIYCFHLLYKTVTKKYAKDPESNELVESSEKTEDLFEQQAAFVRYSPSPVIRTNLEGEVVLCNPASIEVFGRYMYGEKISQLFPELKRFSISKLTDSKAFKFEYTISEKTFLFTVLKHPPTSSIYIYGNDITEIKSLEKIKDTLTQMIVHDLNNPLSAIRMSMEFLEGQLTDTLNDKQRDVFHIVLEESMELKNMISNLLDISKMEEGKLKLRAKKLDPVELVERAVHSMNAIAHRGGKDISVQCFSQIPKVTADEDILRRIMLNLMGNALKFTPSKSVIEVMLNHKIQDNEVIFGVKDQGEGIESKYHNLIFEKFGQVEASQLKGKTGKGFGLTFCKMAVEAHNGRIWIESEVGKGATFYFTLPLSE